MILPPASSTSSAPRFTTRASPDLLPTARPVLLGTVSERRLSIERESALVRLLDDETPAVRDAVASELKRLGPLGLDLLRRLARDDDPEQAAHAKQFLERIEGPDPAGEFTRFIRSLHYELETGSILLSRVVQPNLATASIYEPLDRIASRCRELMVHPSPVWERCKILNRVLFHEWGFRGNSEDFDDPHNSFLSFVLRRRKGIPITLSILYLLVARRCGLELEPIGMPGRFLVGCFLEKEPFFIDPYERGGFRSGEELMEILQTRENEAGLGALDPVPIGEVLCRSCRNLVRQYSLRNQPARAKMFAGFVREFEETHRRRAHR